MSHYDEQVARVVDYDGPRDKTEDEILNARGHSISRLKETTDSLMKTVKVFGNEESMTKSGKLGANPMISRPGKQTIAEYLVFSNGVRKKDKVAKD